MKKILIIGSGIAGLSCAVSCAEMGMKVTLASPFPSERSQSVLAAGGINAVTGSHEVGDSIEEHINDTLRGGCDIAGAKAVRGLCESAPDIIGWLEKLGTVFTSGPDGSVAKRAFGGQSHRRTCYCGASTGKQIVTALVMEARRYEGMGLIERRLWMDFYGAVIREGACRGAVFYNEATGQPEAITADSVVIATGGQNALFGKTTGSSLCDGYTAGKLFTQGVELKNLEFIQYHPTTLETCQKMMLISEAVRGEGGRLYYNDGGRRVYFMEDRFGERGNLMPRDTVSRCMAEIPEQVYLDVSFIGREDILTKLPEVYELCMKYRGIDITKHSIPVSPSVHFFMGGIAVNNDHKTNIDNLYAIGECASIYHGANRLGGNSLLAAIHGGRVAAKSISDSNSHGADLDCAPEVSEAAQKLSSLRGSQSRYPVKYVRDMLAQTMQSDLGVVRSADKLLKGIDDVSFYLSVADKIRYDNSELPYFGYSLTGILTLAKATLISALSREESRGAHIRSDFPEADDGFKAASIITYDGGGYRVRLDTEGEYES